MISPDKKEYGNFHRQGDGIHTNQRTTFIRLTVNIVAEFLKGLYAKTTYTNFLAALLNLKPQNIPSSRTHDSFTSLLKFLEFEYSMQQ